MWHFLGACLNSKQINCIFIRKVNIVYDVANVATVPLTVV